MNFDLGDDRRMLADLLWRFVEERYGIDERNRAAYGYVGYDPESGGNWRTSGSFLRCSTRTREVSVDRGSTSWSSSRRLGAGWWSSHSWAP
jgi:hypothetical protein